MSDELRFKNSRVVIQAIKSIGDQLIPIEDTVMKGAIEAHRLTISMLEEQERLHRVGLPANAGFDGIRHAAKAAEYLTMAAGCLRDSHSSHFEFTQTLGWGARCPIGELRAVPTAA